MRFFFLKQIIVGAIILIGVTFFIALTIVIGNSDGTFLRSLNVYKSNYREIRGLYVGSEITIQGTRTGNVVHTKILQDGTVEVSFTIKKEHLFMINESSTSQLKTQGALGDRYINIATLDLKAPKLEPNSYIKTAPAIDMLTLLRGGVEKNKKSMESIIGEFNELLINLNKMSSENQREFSSILKSLSSILRKVESGNGSLGAIINDRALYNRLLVLLGERPRHNYLKDLSNKSKRKKRRN